MTMCSKEREILSPWMCWGVLRAVCNAASFQCPSLGLLVGECSSDETNGSAGMHGGNKNDEHTGDTGKW